MTDVRKLTPTQLRTHVAAVRQQVPSDRPGVIGLRTAEGWDGPPAVEQDGRTYVVVSAASPLAVREAVEAAAGREASTVLLTSLEQTELGQDVVARLAGGRLYSVDLWEAVRELFKARRIDPTVRGRAIAQALLDHAPPDGYPPVPAGVLDAGTVWRSLARHGFGMADREPDLAALLRWTASPAAGRYAEAPDELKAALRRRLTDALGAAADSVFAFAESGAVSDALALAAVCGVVFDGGATPPDMREAAARLERFHGNAPVPAGVGARLARAAADALREAARESPPADLPHRERADRLLHEVRAERSAFRSPLTPLGFDQRLERLARELRQAVAPGDRPTADAARACEELLRDVAAHDLSERQPVRVDQARMAVRLVRWLERTDRTAGDLAGISDAYRDDGAFADWARDVLAGGDPLSTVSAAYRAVEERVRRRRTAVNRAFAAALRDATAAAAAPAGVLPVEAVLERVLVPLVRDGHSTLLVVLDGMSWAVAQELLTGLRRAHWQELTPEESGGPPPLLLAAIPSVTEQSRASLLAGQRCQGAAPDEKRLFAQHPGLSAVCTRKRPPRLFHKGELTDGGRGGLADEVSSAVLDGESRVIGVVVNAIDDRLAGAQQVRDRWGIEAIRPLGALLQAARDTGRVVVLAADHGHVWHRDDSAYRKTAEAGERWRPAGDAPADDELLLEGPRVRGRGGEPRVIVPWDEPLRYGTAKNGYHGGAAPQEMLAPLILLAPAGAQKKGLHRCQLPIPDWWEETPAPRPVDPVPVPPAPPGPGRLGGLFRKLDPGSDLSDAKEVAAAGEGLIGRVLASAVYALQKEAAGKHLPDDATVRRCLEALERHGGTLTPAALAQQAGVLPLRLDGLTAKLQRLFNVDGYDVLQVDRAANRVTLNVTLLTRQFELE